jgi:DNA-binding GntR family transcriptional regulator
VADDAIVFEPLGTRTLRDQIADQIRQAIVDGALTQGERLVERKLAAQFGASLSAVREALIELEAKGLVVRTRNSSTHVVRLEADDVEKLFKVRRALEGLVVEEAARCGTREQLDGLRDLLAGMVEDAEAGQSGRFDDRLVQFHRHIWEMADNSYLVDALQRTVLLYFEDSRIRSTAVHSEEYYQRILDSHSAILDAIAAGDPATARDAFEDAFQGWYVRALEKHRQLREIDT